MKGWRHGESGTSRKNPASVRAWINGEFDHAEGFRSQQSRTSAEKSTSGPQRGDLSGADLARGGPRRGASHGQTSRGEPQRSSLRLAPLAGRTSLGRASKERPRSGPHQRGEPHRGGPRLGGSGKGMSRRGADFTGTIIGYTTFGGNDLSDVKGLETVRHVGPSTIGIDTISGPMERFHWRSCAGPVFPRTLLSTWGPSPERPLISIPASSAIPPKIRNSPTACMRIYRTKASAAGSRRTT